MDLELHQVELRYAALRRRDVKRERALLASLTDVGQQAPVVVVRDAAVGWVLVDGYKRVRALRRLHRDTVAAVEWALSEVEALLLTRLMRTAEGDSALEQGWLLRELHERFALSCGELARRFDKSESWVSRRLALVGELPEAVQELVRSGGLPAHAAMKHLVPLARAKVPDWEALAAAAAAHGLSSRQVGVLAATWAAATPEGRALILEQPHLMLRAEEQSRRPKEKSPVERLLGDVAAVGALARRARTLARQEAQRASRWCFTVELQRAALVAEADAGALFETLRTEVHHVG
jgi:ParB/RepB/Spo0J family partition protein